MYIVLVGPSGKCRKGTAMGPGYALLKGANIKMAVEAITREALIRELKTSSDTQVDNEGIIRAHSSLTIYSQELTVFIGYNNQQLMADLADWYDCRESWTYRTKNMGTDEISGVFVNLIGATTPELLQTTMPRDAIGGGLTSRMVFVYEKDKDHVEPAPFLSEMEREMGRELALDLEQICMMSGEFKVTSAFMDRWVEWYTASSKNPPFEDYRFNGYIERRPTHMLKLSMIMSASRSNEKVVDRIDFERALDLLETTEQNMPHTFSGVGKSSQADINARVTATVYRHQIIPLDKLMRMFFQDADLREMTGILETLQSMKMIRIRYEEPKSVEWIGGDLR